MLSSVCESVGNALECTCAITFVCLQVCCHVNICTPVYVWVVCFRGCRNVCAVRMRADAYERMHVQQCTVYVLASVCMHDYSRACTVMCD